ncbi:MAG: hypothetical protein QGF16_02985 [Rhodospirillales bacterium]|nr:hypothetical protein [Rhodospirillales bacterium]
MKKLGKTIFWLLFGLLSTALGLMGLVWIAGTMVPIKLPFGNFVNVGSWNQGYASAEGTWTSDTEKLAHPIQTTKIVCRKNSKACTVAQAQIQFGDRLVVDVDTLPIRKWDDTAIIYTMEAGCVFYVYTINRLTQKVTGIRRKKSSDDGGAEQGCGIISANDLKLSLVQGWRITDQYGKDAFFKALPFGVAAGLIIWIFVGRRIRKIFSREGVEAT